MIPLLYDSRVLYYVQNLGSLGLRAYSSHPYSIFHSVGIGTIVGSEGYPRTVELEIESGAKIKTPGMVPSCGDFVHGESLHDGHVFVHDARNTTLRVLDLIGTFQPRRGSLESYQSVIINR